MIGVDTRKGQDRIPQADQASMGPRRDWRGYSVFVVGDGTDGLLLQWGHAVIGVDTPGRLGREPMLAQLQWGHAVIGVDTSWPFRIARILACFNGATP